MEYVIIVLLAILIVISIVLLILLIKRKTTTSEAVDPSIINDMTNSMDKHMLVIEKELLKEVSQLKDEVNQKLLDTSKQVSEFKESSSTSINNSYVNLLNSVNQRLDEMNKKVEERLTEGFKTNAQGLTQVSEALGRITEAQTNLDSLSKSVNSLNQVLNNTQQRGRFGEVVLENLLHDVFGDVHHCYETQYAMKNKGEEVRPDAVIFLPEPDKLLCIDSKFSFEPYLTLFDPESPKESKDSAKKELKSALVSQINKIAKDYIIHGETCLYAIMFIPNDGFYAYIQSDNDLYDGVVTLARKKNVVICSPSTLQPILANLRALKINVEISKNISSIIKEIDALGAEFNRFAERWTRLDNQYETVNKTRKELNITVEKITKKSSDIISDASKKKLTEESETVLENN